MAEQTHYWVCPKMTCWSMLIFDDPYLPCAKHGDMVRDNEISIQKRVYQILWRKYHQVSLEKIKDWFTGKLFWPRTGIGMKVANGGNPVDELVIRYKDFYFGIMIDAESGEPTGDFGWSRDPMMFHAPIREHYVATRKGEK